MSRDSEGNNNSTDSSAARAQARYQQAVALHQQGQLEQARSLYEDILAEYPDHYNTVYLSAIISVQTHDFDRAISLLNKAVTLKPDDAEAYVYRGLALHGAGQTQAALDSFDRAIALNPDLAEAWHYRGTVLKKLGRTDAALDSFDKTIALNPDSAEAYFNRGNILSDLKQMDAALDSYDRAIAITPDKADAWSNRGNVLKDMNRLNDAIASYDHAITLKPDLVEAYTNRGITLQGLNQVDAAIASYDRAIAINPDYAEAWWYKSFALLLKGDLEAGWELYEWRWKRAGITSPMKRFPQPFWSGHESLKNKTILLYSEQGYGDAIQFCRYVRLVAELGANVILITRPPLFGLFEKLEGVFELIMEGSPLPPFDYHCTLLSLPLAFRTNLTTIPSARKYLYTDPVKLSQWTQRLGSKKAPRIGLVWSGSISNTNDLNRSISLSDLIAFLPPDYQYVSLQKEVRTEDDVTLQSHSDILRFDELISDFTDTAALCELMDIVISVDTSVAHLSGALGRPTWILLPFSPDWRWLLDRNDSPWYPSVKLYRQETAGDWNRVFSRVAADLKTCVTGAD